MLKLSKEQLKERETYLSAVVASKQTLEAAIERFNEQLLELKDPVEEAVASLNEALTDAGEWMTTVRGDMENFFEEKSEKWRDSDTGQAYYSWLEEFTEIEGTIEVEFPQPLDMPDTDGDSILENLPDAP